MKSSVKKLIALVTAVIMMLTIFTGCMSAEDKLVINENGSGSSATTIMVDKAAADEFMKLGGATLKDFGLDTATVETVNGKPCYVVRTSATFADYQQLMMGLSASDYTEVYASEKGIHFVLPSQVKPEDAKQFEELYGNTMDEIVHARVEITMPKEIIKTTGKGVLSADKKTVTYDFNLKDFYEDLTVMAFVEADEGKPVFKGFKNNAKYNSAVKVSVTDNSGIKSVKYKKDGGKYYSAAKVRSYTKNGKYTVVATDNFDNKTVKSFTIKDTKSPVVTGVANKKTYTSKRVLKFKDNCGIKKATLNGKVIRSGKAVSKKGSYKLVVTDINGLKKVVTFKIK